MATAKTAVKKPSQPSPAAPAADNASAASQTPRKRATANVSLAFKRVYDAPDPSDGTRVLADRLWPRGLAKAKAQVDLWAKDITPSTPLRQWFHQHPDQFGEFRDAYLQELKALADDDNAMLAQVRDLLANGHVTLLTAAHRLEDDEPHTHLHVLREFLLAN